VAEKPFLPDAEVSSVTGVCTKVYTELSVAKVVSPRDGTFHVALLPESGIRTGDFVAVSVTGGIPVAVRPIKFGFTPEKIVVLNLFPKQGEKHISFNKTTPEWTEKEAEQIGLEPIVVKRREGEKVYRVGMNGVHIAHDKTALFCTPVSKMYATEDSTNLVSPGTRIINKYSFYYKYII